MKNFLLRVPRKSGVDEFTFEATGSAEILEEIHQFARLSIEILSPSLCVLTANVRVMGGKGGFGRLLRSQKNLGKKTDNFDSCRDLEGRREGSNNRNKRVDELASKEAEDKKSVKIPQEVKSNPVTLDDTYTKKLTEIRKEKETAVVTGFETLQADFPIVQPLVKKLKKTVFDEDSD